MMIGTATTTARMWLLLLLNHPVLFNFRNGLLGCLCQIRFGHGCGRFIHVILGMMTGQMIFGRYGLRRRFIVVDQGHSQKSCKGSGKFIPIQSGRCFNVQGRMIGITGNETQNPTRRIGIATGPVGGFSFSDTNKSIDRETDVLLFAPRQDANATGRPLL